MEAVVHSINVNPSGGVPKHPVPLTRLTVSGVEGDRQNDLKHHGGPSRAVSLFSSELIEALQEEGHPIQPGSTGENLTLRGVMWQDMAPGVRLRIGTAHLEITAPAPLSSHSSEFQGRELHQDLRANPFWLVPLVRQGSR